MDTGKRSKRQRVWALWSGNTKAPSPKSSSSTTDDIPQPAAPSTDQPQRRLTRHASVPLPKETYVPPLSVYLSSLNRPIHATMACNATITFSQTGVQPPVYVVTPLSDPPWETLEMQVDKEQTTSANLIFTRQFNKVAEGSYQYKIRIGEGHWVLDESKESAADEHGNRNNVIHVRPVESSEPTTSASNAQQRKRPLQPHVNQANSSESKDLRNDIAMHSNSPSQPSDVPVPFVVVEKVPDQERPEYGDVEPSSLPTNETKRTADPEPDLERAIPESAEWTGSKSPEVPLLVVEKVDDKPAHGDDFGEKATVAQQVAHDMRAADASPDQLVVAPDIDDDADTGVKKLEATPLFRYESGQIDEPDSSPMIQSVSEESEEHSTEQNGHTVVTGSENKPLLPHEIEDEEEGFDELNHGPLLRHESGSNGHFGGPEGERSEFNAAPLLSHETELLQHNNSNPNAYHHEDYDSTSDYDSEKDEAPLLPHERGSAVHSESGSDRDDHKSFSMHRQPSFDHENGNAEDMFGGRSIFRSRTDSSTLPHWLPRSDAEDDNLHDPSLERFPTDRAHILERVATIGLHLPEDQTLEETSHSPVMSVLSQACSSVDLIPVKSYASLASVPEDDNSDEEEADMESLPSPVVLNFARSSSGVARETLKTPLIGQSLHSDQTKNMAAQDTSTQEPSFNREGPSIVKQDETKENSSVMLQEIIAAPTTILNSMSPTLITGKTATPKDEQSDADPSDTQLRKRSVVKEDDPKKLPTPIIVASGPGEHKLARAAIVVAGVTAAAWYFFGTA